MRTAIAILILFTVPLIAADAAAKKKKRKRKPVKEPKVEVVEEEVTPAVPDVEEPPPPPPAWLHRTDSGFAQGERALGEGAGDIPCDAFAVDDRVDVPAEMVPAIADRARACAVESIRLVRGPTLNLQGEFDAVVAVEGNRVRVYHRGAAAECRKAADLERFAQAHRLAIVFRNRTAPEFSGMLARPEAVWVYLPEKALVSSWDPESRALYRHLEYLGPRVPQAVPAGASVLTGAFGEARFVTVLTSEYPRWADLGLIACKGDSGEPLAIAIVRGDDPRERRGAERRARASLIQMVHGIEQSRSAGASVSRSAGTLRGTRVVKDFVRPDGFFALAMAVALPRDRAHFARQPCDLPEEPRSYQFVRVHTLYRSPQGGLPF